MKNGDVFFEPWIDLLVRWQNPALKRALAICGHPEVNKTYAFDRVLSFPNAVSLIRRLIGLPEIQIHLGLQKCADEITDADSYFASQHLERVNVIFFETFQRLNNLRNLSLNLDNSHLVLHSSCPSTGHTDSTVWTHVFLRYRYSVSL